jgi:Ca2+-transporting ATPase
MTTIHGISLLSSDKPTESTPAFRSIRRWASELGQPNVAFTKGAVDGLLQVTGKVLTDGRIVDFDADSRERFTANQEALASQGMRILGVACSKGSYEKTDAVEKDLIFIGMVR